MFSYGSGDYSGLLLFSFANNKFSHDAAVVIIQMTDRFIQKKEIERLAECSDKGKKTGKFDGWLFEEEPCGNNGWSGRCCALRFLRGTAGRGRSEQKPVHK